MAMCLGTAGIARSKSAGEGIIGRQSWLLQSEPVLRSQPPRTQELAAGLADGFKDHC